MKNRTPPRKTRVVQPAPSATQVVPVPLPPLPLELRRIEDTPFGMGEIVKDAMGVVDQELTDVARLATAERVRRILREYGCTVAGDIDKLGCTGLATLGRLADVVETGTFLRLGLAGSGFGLPCFVPPSRFCLVHNTIGGLEPRQAPRHTMFVNNISRALTPTEEAKTKAMQHAQSLRSADEVENFMAGKAGGVDDQKQEDFAPTEAAGDDRSWLARRAAVLWAIAATGQNGISRAVLLQVTRMESMELETVVNTLRETREITKRLRDGAEVYFMMESAPPETVNGPLAAPVAQVITKQMDYVRLSAWKCPEHEKMNWACRYCVAQAIVEGPLSTEFVSREVHPTGGAKMLAACEGKEIDALIDQCNKDNVTTLVLYVRAATFTMKLARD